MSDQNPKIPSAILEASNNIVGKNISYAVAEEPEMANLEKTLASIAGGPLQAAIQKATQNPQKGVALAFTQNPAPSDNYLGLFKAKRRLLPDELIKQIRITDHLVAAILRTRSNMMSLFGHLRNNRFDIGSEILIKPEFYKILTPEQFEKVSQRMKRFEQLLLNCGHTTGLELHEHMTLAEYLRIQTGNSLAFGRMGTEVIYDRTLPPDENGNYPFHRFRPVDIATIFKAVRKGESAGNTLRLNAIKALESITGDKLDIDVETLKADRYAWFQVVDGTPRQAFTHDEMLVFNMFPSSDIELNGYPVTPLDTLINTVTTHISIDSYRKMYFQNGRASKGMLVIKSDEVDQAVLDNMKLQFNASINSVSNAFRTPIFGVGTEDEVQWVSLVGEGLGDEFQFMYDGVARTILAAFGVSPDELPGYAHLSKGTNSQTLSESNNEYKMTAARDSGLRPLVLNFQMFFNQRLFPLLDPMLAEICEIKFSGIDAKSAEQESARLQQDSALHMSYNDILHEVDKDLIPTTMGGKFPFSERYQLVLDKYKNVGDVLHELMGSDSSIVDPMLKYKRDPFFLQQIQLLASVNPSAVQAYYAPKPYSLDFLKLCIQDRLEEDDD